MTVKVKKRLNIKSLIAEIKETTAKKADNKISRAIELAIREQIASGLSPVAGKGKFKKYSKEYAKRKGVSETSVDMIVSGEMLSGLKVKRLPPASWLISFKGKIAEYHNEGMGNNPKRRLLPGKGETFKKKIIDAVIKIVKQSIGRKK